METVLSTHKAQSHFILPGKTMCHNHHQNQTSPVSTPNHTKIQVLIVTLLQNFPRKSIGKQAGEKMGVFAAVGVLLPFPYYYWLWTNPQAWVNLCGKDKNPSKVMSYVSHFLKLLQFISLFSVSTLSWPPPLYFWPLFGFGQFLNFRSVNHCTIYI
jgi:hypothetical protein